MDSVGSVSKETYNYKSSSYSNNSPEFSVTLASSAHLTSQICRNSANNEEMIHLNFDIESDSDSSDDELLSPVNTVSSRTLCSNSCMTVDTAVLNFVHIYITNNKTNGCLKDDLRFLTSALPKQNEMPKTVFKLFEYVKQQAPPCKIITHYCCKICQFYYGTRKEVLCKACNSDRGYISFFEIDIIDQIRYLFECKHLADVLDKARRNIDINVITDITDGSEYKRVNTNRKQYDITLMLNTDGACIKKSSTASLWPICFMIAEIPPYLRRSFIMCAGIWYANTKPEMNTFLRPLCLKLQFCFKQGGLTWIHPTTNTSYKSLIRAPLIIADAPARAMVLNMQNHNGKYGCHTCEIKTKRIHNPKPGKKHRRVYKFCPDRWNLRTKEKMLICGKMAELTYNISKSIKGRTVVHILPGSDESTIVFAEFMHLFCLGVIRHVLTLWTEKPGQWYIKEYIDAIDDFLLKIKPPNTFGRLPRELKHRKFWKAYENLYWALFYSLLAVKNYLPDKYFQHWMLLIISLNLLLQEQMSISDLNKVNMLLTRFVSEFETLYGEAELTYNLHQLQHVALNVQRWGPVWSNSAYAFESFIGILAKMIHGSKHIGKELVNKLQIIQGLQVMSNRNEIQATLSSNSCLGKSIQSFKFTEHEKYLLDSADVLVINVNVFARAKIKGQIYTSLLYKKINTVSYCVRCRVAENSVVFGAIKFFLTSPERGMFFVLEPFEIDQGKILFHQVTQTKVDHILPIKEGGPSILLHVTNIISMMKVLLINDYICIVPKTIRKCLL